MSLLCFLFLVYVLYTFSTWYQSVKCDQNDQNGKQYHISWRRPHYHLPKSNLWWVWFQHKIKEEAHWAHQHCPSQCASSSRSKRATCCPSWRSNLGIKLNLHQCFSELTCKQFYYVKGQSVPSQANFELTRGINLHSWHLQVVARARVYSGRLYMGNGTWECLVLLIK